MCSKAYLILLLTFLIPAKSLISESKCKEYSAGNCKPKAIPLIVGGIEANEKEFPHTALIGYGKETVTYECGGSLISELFVLSAAHCSYSKESGMPTKIKLGIIERDYTGSELQVKDIDEVITHPDYKKTLKYNDIALFKIKTPVEFTPYVRPACLNFHEDVGDLIPVATGFGKTKFTEDNGNNKLMKVDLPILDNAVCQPFYATMQKTTLNRGGLIDTMICAGSIEGGKDTCQGDSGGPLQVYMEEPFCIYSIIGVTSFGKFCGYAKSPAIYTRVYKYIPWIEEVVWGDENVI